MQNPVSLETNHLKNFRHITLPLRLLHIGIFSVVFCLTIFHITLLKFWVPPTGSFLPLEHPIFLLPPIFFKVTSSISSVALPPPKRILWMLPKECSSWCSLGFILNLQLGLSLYSRSSNVCSEKEDGLPVVQPFTGECS